MEKQNLTFHTFSNPKNWARGLRLKVTQELGITTGAIYQWDKVPAERVPEVSRITGYSRHELRPDLYELEELAAAAAARKGDNQ